MKKFLRLTAVVGFVILGALACDSQEFVSAKMYIQQGDLETAEQFFLQALELPAEAQNAKVPYLLANQVYAPQRRYEDMNKMLKEALKRGANQKFEGYTITELVKNTRQVQWQEEYQRGANLYNEIVNQSQGAALTEQLNEAMLKAVGHFETSLRIWPQETRAYTNLVYCYRQLGDKAAEDVALDQAISMNPDDGIILMLAGDRAETAKALEEAVGYYERAHDILPDDVAVMQRLTSVYLDMDNPEAALETLEETQKHSPRDPDVYYNIGAVYANIGNDALQKGQDIYRVVVGIDPIDKERLAAAVKSFKQAQSAYSEALYFMDNSLALNPDDDAAAKAVSEIQSTKRILDTMQRSAEQFLR